MLAGILHWRLHLMIFVSTFIVFPLLGLALQPVSGTLIAPPLYVGLLFLCTLPSTVQASVIFTSVAGGNVAAALCSASLSSIIGMALTPLLVGLLLQAHGESSVNGVVSIALQLLLPFLLGQVAAALARAVDEAEPEDGAAGRSRLDPADGLRRDQRRDAVGHVAAAAGVELPRPRALVDGVLLAVMLVVQRLRRPPPRLRARGRDRHRCSAARRRA